MPAPYLFSAVCITQCEMIQVQYASLATQKPSAPLMQVIFQVCSWCMSLVDSPLDSVLRLQLSSAQYSKAYMAINAAMTGAASG
jgi:hypothetical protein